MAISEHNRVVTFPEQVRADTKSPTPTDRRVGARIRMQRTLIGMSQEKLGELLGITFQQVQKYEKGTNRIGAGRLLAISNALGVPVTYFFEEYGAPSERSDLSAIERLLSTREGVALAEAFVRIESSALRRALINLARAAASQLNAERASPDD